MKKKTGRKLLGILLSLALVLGMMPEMSLTAYADDPYASINTNFHLKHRYNPLSASDALNDAGRQIFNHVTQTINHVIQSMKDFISETAFADLLPNLFDRVHFRGVRRNKDQCDAFRNLQFVCLMPHCSVAYQQDLIIRIRLGQFREKHIHTICIAVGKHQEETLSVLRFYRPIHIAVFADVVTWN